MTREELESKRQRCEVFARVVGYIRPTFGWNEGKKEEYKDRKVFKVKEENDPTDLV